MKLRRLLVLSVLGSLPLVLGGCSLSTTNPKPTAPAGSVVLQGAGSTFIAPLLNRWSAAYQSAHPKTVIAYDAVGSGEGVRRFIGQNVKEEEKVDFGASDAAMTDEQIAHVPGGAVMLPATAGCVTLSYNLPDFDGDLKLSRQAYAAIFLGQVKNWNDPLIARSNPGAKLPKLTLTTVVRQDSSGTTYAFTKNLDAISDTWRGEYGAATLVNWPGNAMRAKGNEGVAGLILHSNGSIGYVGLEFAQRLGLKMALVENKNGEFVKPSGESCATALASAEMPENLRVFVPDPSAPGAYPIVTFSWILLYKNYENPAKAEAIRDLFRWCVQDGQEYAPQLGYVRLPPNVVAKDLAALQPGAPEAVTARN